VQVVDGGAGGYLSTTNICYHSNWTGYKAWRYISGHEKTLAQNLSSHGKSDISTNSSPQILFPGSKLISKPSPSFRKEKLHSSKFPCVDVVVFAAVFFGGARVG
jgi:hypothetical protein